MFRLVYECLCVDLVAVMCTQLKRRTSYTCSFVVAITIHLSLLLLWIERSMGSCSFIRCRSLWIGLDAFVLLSVAVSAAKHSHSKREEKKNTFPNIKLTVEFVVQNIYSHSHTHTHFSGCKDRYRERKWNGSCNMLYTYTNFWPTLFNDNYLTIMQ